MNLLTISQAWAGAAFEIIIMLLVAFLLGLLLGYLIWKRRKEATIDYGTQNLEVELKDMKSENSRLNSEISVLKSQKSSLEADLKQCNDDKSNMTFASTAPEVSAAAAAPVSSSEKDELKKIEGIGPKIQELFYSNGIYTFNQMSSTPSTRLKEILNSAGPRMQMHDPGSWPSQAKLAAEGKWDELKKLQDELKGGK